MEYEVGDKVVVEITEVDEKDKELTYGVGNPTWIRSKYILGKLEDFQPKEEKIKMTPEEKKEFDRLCQNSGDDIADLFDNIADYYYIYPNLNKRLFLGTLEKNKKVQCEFVRALEKPSLIEAEKEKKYYVHLFKSQKFGYLNQIRDSLELIVSNKNETDKCKTQFTKDEIEKFEDLGFKINDDALEEVEDE